MARAGWRTDIPLRRPGGNRRVGDRICTRRCTPTVQAARYLIILTPRLSALVAALQADRDSTHQQEIYERFGSELLE